MALAMNYDETAIPTAYDAGRSHTPAVLEFWLRTISDAIGRDQIAKILDLGCGTGRYSAALVSHFGAHVVGIDPSEKMLAEARRKGGDRVSFLRGAAEAIPLSDGSIDMIFLSMAFHHVDDPGLAARECHRVLRERGVVCLRTGTSDRLDSYPFVRFFPGSRLQIHRNLHTLGFLEETFEKAAFKLVQHQVVDSEMAANWRLFVEKISHRADSILAQLDDEEFTSGLAALRSYAHTAPEDEPVREPIDLFVFCRA
jgi:ubiquinone/menaquinone biosynthesis C-methylase UbiE